MDRRFLLILAGIIAVFGGLLFFTQNNNNDKASAAKPTNHVTGNLDSKVTLLNYGDFECNACHAYEPTLLELRQKYGDRVKFQFRHFPIVSSHRNAFAASRAAEAAGKQGKFWEMHDRLYLTSNWQTWIASQNTTGLFEAYAKEIGINIDQFKKDFASSEVNATINADTKAGEDSKVSATPSFLLNGRMIPLNELLNEEGRPSLEAFSKIIDAELEKTGQQASPEEPAKPEEPTPEAAQAQ